MTADDSRPMTADDVALGRPKLPGKAVAWQAAGLTAPLAVPFPGNAPTREASVLGSESDSDAESSGSEYRPNSYTGLCNL
jgi:hypothetical protein